MTLVPSDIRHDSGPFRYPSWLLLNNNPFTHSSILFPLYHNILTHSHTDIHTHINIKKLIDDLFLRIFFLCLYQTGNETFKSISQLLKTYYERNLPIKLNLVKYKIIPANYKYFWMLVFEYLVLYFLRRSIIHIHITLLNWTKKIWVSSSYLIKETSPWRQQIKCRKTLNHHFAP